MLTLTHTTDKITVVLDSAPAIQLPCIITYKTLVEQRNKRPDKNIVLTTGVTPVTLLDGNAIEFIPVLVDGINIYNPNVADVIVTIRQEGAESLVAQAYTVTLPPKRSLQYTIEAGFFLTDTLIDIEAELEQANATLTSIDNKVSTAAKQDTGNTSLNNIDTNLGAKTDAAATTDTGTFSLIALFKRLLQWTTSYLSSFESKIGATNETAPTTDTGASGLNGRMQRTAQNITNLLYTFNGTFDAFYRHRFSEPVTIFDSKQIGDKQPLFWDDQLISGSGGASTYNTNQASTTLSVSLNTAAVRARQTFRRFNYQPGKSQMIMQTGVWGSAATGIKRKAGLFDANNGIFFDQISTGMGVTIRTFTSGSPVDTRVAQSAWNLDKMDGTGTSGVNLDFTKAQVWFMDFEGLLTGDVSFGWFVGRKPIYCHVFHNSNVLALAWISTPNLPVRYEIENTGTGAAVGFTQICSTVISEGGLQDTGFPFGIGRGTNPLVTGNDTNIYALIAIRLNSGYLGSTIRLSDFNITCITTATFNYFLILNPTVTGTAFSFTQVTNSSVDIDVGRTSSTTLSGGTILHAGDTTQTNESGKEDILKNDFFLGSNIAGVADIVVLAVQKNSVAAETFYGSLNWKDQQ